jgi:hypothetical protein
MIYEEEPEFFISVFQQHLGWHASSAPYGGGGKGVENLGDNLSPRESQFEPYRITSPVPKHSDIKPRLSSPLKPWCSLKYPCRGEAVPQWYG